MTAVLDILGWVALLSGGFFCVVGAIGLNRMPPTGRLRSGW